MNIIQDLMNDILDPEASLSVILRKASVLAFELKNQEFKQWVDYELDEYPTDKVPDYRRWTAINYGEFYNTAYHMTLPIPLVSLAGPLKEFAKEVFVIHGVRALESLVESGSQEFEIHWPADLVALYLPYKIYRGCNCFKAWKVVTKSEIEQILETIRNRLLKFVLELKVKYPDVVKSVDAIQQVPTEWSRTMFNITVTGNNNTIGAGSDIAQQVNQNVQTNNIESLAKFLGQSGVSNSDVSALKNAIAQDPGNPDKGTFGPKVSEWVGKLVQKALSGTWKVGSEVATTIIPKAISKYYGWD